MVRKIQGTFLGCAGIPPRTVRADGVQRPGLGAPGHPGIPATCPARGGGGGGSAARNPLINALPLVVPAPPPCYANEGASHWLGSQRSIAGQVRGHPWGPGWSGGARGTGRLSPIGEAPSLAPSAPAAGALFPGAPCAPGQVTFASRLPESWGPGAALSPGAVPWQRGFWSEPDFCSGAGFASSPSPPGGGEPAPCSLGFRLPADPPPPGPGPRLPLSSPPPSLSISLLSASLRAPRSRRKDGRSGERGAPSASPVQVPRFAAWRPRMAERRQVSDARAGSFPKHSGSPDRWEPTGGRDGGGGRERKPGMGERERDRPGLSLHFDSMETLLQTRDSFPSHFPVPATG